MLLLPFLALCLYLQSSQDVEPGRRGEFSVPSSKHIIFNPGAVYFSVGVYSTDTTQIPVESLDV